MKSCAIVQVRNGYEYIPAFLAHHERLVDEIILIDHDSSRDLRGLERPGLQVYRANIAAFAKDLFINYLLDRAEVRTRFDLLFVLDIDEFLPFRARDDLMTFEVAHAGSPVMLFYWRNGYCERSDGIDAEAACHFTRHRSPTRKLVYNLKRVRRFLPRMGNHSARYPILNLAFLQTRPRPVDTGLGLFHIPFLGLDGLRRKIRDNPTSNFANKIKGSMDKLNLKQGLRWIDEPVDNADLLQMVANYRTSEVADIFDVTADDFERVDLFAGLGDAIEEWRKRLNLCPPATLAEPTTGEAALVQRLRAMRFFEKSRLAAAFVTSPDREIRFAPRAKRSWRALFRRDR